MDETIGDGPTTEIKYGLSAWRAILPETTSSRRATEKEKKSTHLGDCAAGVQKKLHTLLDLCVSSLRRGHANLLCIAARGKRLIRVFLDAVRE